MARRRRAPEEQPPQPPELRLVDRTDAEVRLQQLEARADRWVNYATGLGTFEDKTRHGMFEQPLRLGDVEITALASGNDLAAKCIEKRPDEMFRRGYELEAQQAGDIDKSDLDECVAYAQKKLQADVRLQEGMTFGRQYGGALCILGIDDGREPWEPVDEQNIKSISYINQIDRRFSYVLSYYSDYQQPAFGQPEMYLVANGVATSSYRSADGQRFGYRRRTPDQIRKASPQATILNIHETRLLRFDGITPDLITRQTLAGWSWSVLQRPYEILRLCDGSFDALGYLISDFSQGVFKLKGLFKAISTGNEQKLQQRVKLMDDMRSVMRSLAIDADGGEDFTRVTTPMSGIPDAIDRIMQRLAAAMDMPVTELFGISPAGLNATGESDRIKWYDTIATEQKKYLGPKLERLYRLISLAKDGPFNGEGQDFKIKFHPLYSPTDDELAATRLKNAQRDQIYIETEAATPQQVALTLGDIYSSIDTDALEAEVEAKTKFDPFENDPLASAKAQFGAGGANGSVPEGQSPTVPLPGEALHQTAGAAAGEGEGTPSDPNTGNPRGKPPTGTRHTIEIKVAPGAAAKKDAGAQSPRQAVYELLSEDYPPSALSWVTDDAVQWAGPMRVEPDRIDYSGRARWAANREHAKVGAFRERIENSRGAADEKPIVLVKTPGKAALDIADGHHRGLAYRLSRKPALAFIARVPSKTGPWDEMHSQQHEGVYESKQLPRGPRADEFDPDQPRDEHGQWTSGGGSGGASAKGAGSHGAGAAPKQPFSTYGQKIETPNKSFAQEELALEAEEEAEQKSLELTGKTLAPPLPEKAQTSLLSTMVTSEALSSGGFSYRPGAKAPTSGYMVSLPTSAGVNHVIDVASLAKTATSERDVRKAVDDQVHAWIDKTLPGVKDKDEHYLGGWMQKDESGHPVALHLDVSQRFTDRELALAAGRERNQLAVWHLDKMEEIPTGGTGK